MARQPVQSKKKISIREHLPLFVRIHYDVVRNFAPIKLIGLGVMLLMAALGILLAVQTVSPSSSAAVSSITLRQLNTNQVEAVISNAGHAPRYVMHMVSDNSACDQSIYHEMIQNGKGDPYEIIEAEGWDKREHYQGDDSDNWEVIWNADNSHSFKFLFPIAAGSDHGFIGDQAVGNPEGKYLCMRVAYNDNNADLKDYKQISLLQVKSLVREGANFKFTANQQVYWSAVKTADLFDTCEGAVDTSSGQLSTAFTLETTEADNYKYFCVKGRNATGLQAYKLIYVRPVSATPTQTTEEQGENNQGATTESHFNVVIRQFVDSEIRATAALFLPGDTIIDSWKYAIVDADTVSLSSKRDCQAFFGSDAPDGLLVNAQTITSQVTNEASLKISTQYSGEWICVQATDQLDNVDHGFMLLNHPSDPVSQPQQQNNEQTEDPPENPAPEPEPEPAPDPAPEPEPDQNNQETGAPQTATGTINRVASPEDSSAGNQAGSNTGGGLDEDNNNERNSQGSTVASQVVPEDKGVIPDTGTFGENKGWVHLSGYILIAAAILGTCRIMVIKNYRKNGYQ